MYKKKKDFGQTEQSYQSSVCATYNFMLNMNKGDSNIGLKHKLRNIHKS